MIDLVAEREASLARNAPMREEEALNTNAHMLRLDYAAADSRTPHSLDEVARRRWQKWDDEQIAQVVERAENPTNGGRHVSAVEAGILGTQEVRDITRLFLQREPGANATAAWEHVQQHGTPRMKESSYRSWIVVEVRRELGIVSKNGPKTSRRGKAAGVAKKPAEKVSPVAQDVRDATRLFLGRQAALTAPPAPPAASISADSDNSVDSDNRRTKPEHPSVMEISTANGQLSAEEIVPGRWRVSLSCELRRDAMAQLVARFILDGRAA